MERLVTGRIKRLNNTPWANCTVNFRLSFNSYTSDYQYPISRTSVKTDNFGYFQLVLWCSEEGEASTEYICTIAGVDEFKFVLPVGTIPLDLSNLRLGGIAPSNPNYPTLITYINEQIARELEDLDIEIGATKELLSDSYVATKPLSALRLINLVTVDYASCDELNVQTIGLLKNAIAIGNTFNVMLSGVISDSNWNWQLDTPIFLGVNGTLTQNIPSTAKQIVQVASVINSQKIFINIGEIIKL
jgi:hypothetical protein